MNSDIPYDDFLRWKKLLELDPSATPPKDYWNWLRFLASPRNYRPLNKAKKYDN